MASSSGSEDVVKLRLSGAWAAASEISTAVTAWVPPTALRCTYALATDALAGVDGSANPVTCASASGARTTWLSTGNTSDTLPAGDPDRCSSKEPTSAVVNVSTSSVLGRPPGSGERNARLTFWIVPFLPLARRTSLSRANEDVLNRSPTWPDVAERCTEVMRWYPDVGVPRFR